MPLKRIKNSIGKFASTISKTLDVDVIIVDRAFDVVAHTYRYYEQDYTIRNTSIISQSIRTGKVLAVQDRRKLDTCQECPEQEFCEMRGVVAVPILCQGQVEGAIALIIPKQRVSAIFRDVDNSIEFLQNMAALISSRIQDSNAYDALEKITQEREILMDQMEFAVAAVDPTGVIAYHNRRFQEIFRQGESCVGQPIYELVPVRAITDFLNHQTPVDKQIIFVEKDQVFFYGLLTCKRTVTKDRSTGALFVFKPAVQISSEFAGLTERGTQIALEQYIAYYPPEVGERAKRLAEEEGTLLIQGPAGMGKSLLAQCIHNASARSRYTLECVDCGGPQDWKEKALFGGLGCMQMAHRGAVLLQNVERLPRFLQEQLGKFLRDGTLRHNGVSIQVNVRVICTTDADLAALTERGVFSRELYGLLSENKLVLSPVREDRELLRRTVENWTRAFRERYHKPELRLTPEAMEALCRFDWPENLRQVEAVLDQMAFRFDGPVTSEDLQSLPAYAGERMKSLDDVERERILALLAGGSSREEAARTLGISRATLYRKLKQYEQK